MKLKKLAALLAAAGLTQMSAVAAHDQGLAQAELKAELKQHVAQEKQKLNIYQARFPNLELARKAAISFHANLLEAKYETGHMIFELNPEEKAALEKFGFKMSVAHDFINKRNAMLDRLHASGQSATLLGKHAALVQGTQQEAIPSYACYETVEETYSAAQGFTTSYPNLAAWNVVGKSWQKSANLGGYDLYVLKLTNKSTTGNKPKLFIQSAMHAREYTTAPLTLAFARDLLSGYGSNADATWILDHHEVHIMLHANPDGRKKAETGLSWRKNTNQNYCGSTSSKRGADLNRNYSATWNITNGQGSSGTPCNDTYRGPVKASEPETQAVEAYVRSLWADRRGPGQNDPAPADTSGIHLDIHSYGQLVLWPYGATTAKAPNATALQTLGRRLAWFNGYTPQQSVGLYPTDGTSDDVSYVELGVAAYTLELGTSFFDSCSNYTNTIKPKNLPALWYAAKVLRTPYLTPTGPDVSKPVLLPNAATTAVTAGTSLAISSSATDTRFSTRNGTEATQAISAAEYYIDVPPWSAGAVAQPMVAGDGAFNASTEAVKATIATTGLSVGKHIVYVRAKDASGAWGPISAEFILIK
jgi:carboxypeptidase T